jgi:hypothetical protein
MSDDDQQFIERLRNMADEVESRTTGIVDGAQAAVDKAEAAVSKFRATLQSIMDNIAWVAGLPAVLGGGFGFLKSNADESASTDWQIEQLTTRVVELESQNDLLGGNQKNFSLNLSDAPGGSITAALAFLAVGVIIAGAVWWQTKRRRR